MDLNEKLRLRKDKYIVAEATRLDKEILKIKSAVAGLTIDDYVNRAIKDHKLEERLKERHCGDCNSKLELRHYDDEEVIYIKDIEHKIKLLNIPYAECPKCEKGLVTLRAGVGIERITDLLFRKKLQETRGKELLESIDFSEILY